MSDSKPSFLAELKSLAIQGRDDFVLALQHPSAESMQLTQAPPVPDTPPLPESDFRSVLAEYASRGQGHEPAERGHELDR